MEVLILFIVMISSAAQQVKKNLSCTEGGSITLPDPVMEFGFLRNERDNIAMVNNRELKIFEESFRDRLLWNKDTGLFTVTRLQKNDSGIYTIDHIRGVDKSYHLTVYESAPMPVVIISSVSADSCTLVCFVEKSHETVLYWYKGEEVLNQTSSFLSLPLTVAQQDFNSSYGCVSANPAGNKTLPVNVASSCREENNGVPTIENNRKSQQVLIPIVVIVVIFVVVIIIIGVYVGKKRKRDRQPQDSVKREVVYVDVNIVDHRNRQEGNLPDSSLATDRSNLTTVYDTLEVHRMALTDTDAAEHA